MANPNLKHIEMLLEAMIFKNDKNTESKNEEIKKEIKNRAKIIRNNIIQENQK